eukprot:c17180_g1_i1 orf=289-1716(+)
MFKNQLQELAQRSCFNLPSYSCIREGPDHAPRFKSTVTFNGESFESPGFCNTLRQAEHAAAEVALNALSQRGPTQSLAARILDETGVCKNLLQETAQRAGVNLPVYSVVRSGPGHMPLFEGTVQLAGMIFHGESAKTKKQAEKNAAMSAWASLKQSVTENGSSSSQSPTDTHANEEQLQMIVRTLMMAAAQESSTAPRTPGPTPLTQPPPSTRPVPNPRIKITPLEELSGQETMNAQAPSSWTSVDAQVEPMTGQEQAAGSFNEFNGSPQDSSNSSVPWNSNTANRMVASRSGNIIRGQRAAQVHTLTIIPGTDSQMTFFPIGPFQPDDQHWYQSGSPTITIITKSNDISSSDNRVPLVPSTYPPGVWTEENYQNMCTISVNGSGQPTNSTSVTGENYQNMCSISADGRGAQPANSPSVISSAPRVRVRQTTPVYSSFPCPAEPEKQGTHTTEADVQQTLSRLNLKGTFRQWSDN